MTVSEIKEKLAPLNNRGAWNRGVKEYAIELLDGLEEGLENGLHGFQNPVAAQAANKGGGHPAALSWQHLWLSC